MILCDVLEWFIISICGIAKSLLICTTCLDDKHVKRHSKVTSPMQIIIDTVMVMPPLFVKCGVKIINLESQDT